MATQNINLSFVKTFSNLGKSSSPTPIDPTPQKGVYVPTKVVEQKTPSIEQFRVFSGSAVLPEAMDPSRFKIHNEGSDEPYGSGVGLPVNLSLDEMLSDGRFLSLDNTIVQDFNYNFSFSASARLNPDYFYQPELSSNSELKINEDYQSLGYAEDKKYAAGSDKIDSASKDLSEADDYQYNVNAADEFYKDKETFEKGVNKSLGSGKAEKYVIPKGEVDVSRFLTNSVFVNKELESLDLKDTYDLSYAKKLSTLGSRSLLETIITDYGRYAEDTENTGYLKSATTALVELHTPTLGSVYDILKDKSYKENYDRVFSKKGNDWSDVGRGVSRSAIAAASDIIKAANSWISTPILSFLNIQLNRRSSNNNNSIFLKGNIGFYSYEPFRESRIDGPHVLLKSDKTRHTTFIFEKPDKWTKEQYEFRYGVPHYSIITDSEWSKISNSGGKLLSRASTKKDVVDGYNKDFLNSLKGDLNSSNKNTPIDIHQLPSFGGKSKYIEFIGGAETWDSDVLLSNFRALQDKNLTGDKERDDSRLIHNFMRKTALLGQHQFNLFIHNKFSEEDMNRFPAKRWDKRVIKRWNETDIPPSDYIKKFDVSEKFSQIESVSNLRGFRLKNFEIPEISKTSVKNSYGNTALSLISNSQADSDHTAVITIICDKYLKELEDLNHLTGNGLLYSMKFGSDTEPVQVYDLSTISDNTGALETEAMLQIINGAQIIDSLTNAEGLLLPGTTLDEKERGELPLQSKELTWMRKSRYILPNFLFKNFKIVDLDYDLSFEAGNDAKLLEIKVTVTWTRCFMSLLDPSKDSSSETKKDEDSLVEDDINEEEFVEEVAEDSIEEEAIQFTLDDMLRTQYGYRVNILELTPEQKEKQKAEQENLKIINEGLRKAANEIFNKK